jgi:hypothetical protein
VTDRGDDSIRPPRHGGTGAPGTLTGTVEAGVEAGCLLLRGYQLIGGPRDLLRPGARVRVTGRPAPRLMTTAQQGTPFVVERAEPI